MLLGSIVPLPASTLESSGVAVYRDYFTMLIRSARKSIGSELGPLYLSKQLSLGRLAELEALLKPDTVIDRPEDNLCVLPATDPNIVKYIINSLVHGELPCISKI